MASYSAMLRIPSLIQSHSKNDWVCLKWCWLCGQWSQYVRVARGRMHQQSLTTGSIVKPWTLCDTGYLSEMHLKLKCCKISFVHNICFSCPIPLNFCSEHNSDTAMLCTKFHNDWVTEKQVMGKQDFMKLGFKMSFRQISYMAQLHWIPGLGYWNNTDWDNTEVPPNQNEKSQSWDHLDGLAQERRNSSALAMELCLFCTNPLILSPQCFFLYR